jgi:hypothetical protein
MEIAYPSYGPRHSLCRPGNTLTERVEVKLRLHPGQFGGRQQVETGPLKTKPRIVQPIAEIASAMAHK